MNFNTRSVCISKEIIQARNDAMLSGRFDKSIEPFSIRQKDFFGLSSTRKVS